MDIPKLSDGSLKDLHQALSEALKADDELPPERKTYGVRELPGWRPQADAYEAELTKRKIPFEAIDWRRPDEKQD